MKRFLKAAVCAALCLLLSCAAEEAETVFEGNVYDAYRVLCSESAVEGMITSDYLEPYGLLFSAFDGEREITVTLEPSDSSPKDELAQTLAGVCRYGIILEESEIADTAFADLDDCACVSYSYKSSRDEEEGDVYRVSTRAGRLNDEYVLLATCTSWADGGTDGFEKEFIPSLAIEPCRVSGVYTALVKSCTPEGITIDYCSIGFEGLLGSTYAVNADPAEFVYAPAADFTAWYTDESSLLMSIRRTTDAEELGEFVSEFQKAKNMAPVFNVVFDENGDIIRMQHYNVL